MPITVRRRRPLVGAAFEGRRASERNRDRRERIPADRVATDVEDVRELRELAHDLLEPRVLVHEQEDGAARWIGRRQTSDAVDVEEPPVKEPAHVRHDAGMVAYEEAEDDLLQIENAARRLLELTSKAVEA